MNRDNVIYKVSQETGFSEELVEFVIKDYWNNIYEWLVNPLACGKRITTNQGFHFKIDAYRLGKELSKTAMDVQSEYTDARLYYLIELSKQINNERQTKRGIVYARYGSKFAKGEAWEEGKNLPSEYSDLWKWRNLRPRRKSKEELQREHK